MTLFEKYKEFYNSEVDFETLSSRACVNEYNLLAGHFDTEKTDSVCSICNTEFDDCKKCWSLPYIENVDKETNVPTKNIKVGTKWWDEENNITFFIIEVHGDVVIIEGEIISCSVVSKEYLLKRCKCIDDTDINVGNKSDNVNHPKHYQGKHECIDIMRVLFGDEAVKGFCKCNAFKYRFRAGRKEENTAEQDIQKAEWYEEYLMKMETKS